MNDSPEKVEDAVAGHHDDAAKEGSSRGELQQTFKCGNCAAKMEFEPGAEGQKCPYCGHENPIPRSEADIEELDFRSHLATLSESAEMEERLTIKCSDCAAETTADPNVTSQECAFCGSPIVATAASKKQLRPRSLLPFKIKRDEARTAFGEWIKGRWFAPNDLKRRARSEGKLAGMYVPYWTYDSDTTSFYRGQRGEYYWVTELYTATENGKSLRKTRQVRKIRWWPVSGTVWESFDDVLVLASNSLPRKYTEKLEPWDLQSLAPYKDDYLSGFRAESYQVDLEEGFKYARQIMDAAIRVLVCRNIGGDEQRISSVNTQHDNVTFKHTLLPIWISAYRYSKKIYRFLVNARTGEVQGERPFSWVKITLAVLLAVFIVTTIAVIWAGHQN